MNISYRLCVLNEFTSSRTVLDYRSYGDGRVIMFDAFRVGIAEGMAVRGYQVASDSIVVFVDWKKVLDTKIKAEAVSKVKKLLAGRPDVARKEFEQYANFLLHDLDGVIDDSQPA